MDGNIDRVSYHGHYQVNEEELPMNPFGRTGIGARGKLNRYGPNHCGDAIVTTWKRDANGTIVLDKTTNKYALIIFNQIIKTRTPNIIYLFQKMFTAYSHFSR